MLNIHCLKRYCERIIIFVDIYFFQYPTVDILHDLFPHLLLGIHCNTHKRYLQPKIKKISTSRRTCHLVKIYENTKKESQHPFDKTKVKIVISQHETPLNSFEGCLQRKVIDSSYVAML